jgi:hypothetical protein
MVRRAVLLGLCAGLPAISLATSGVPAAYQNWAFSYSPHTAAGAVTPVGFEYDISWNISDGRFITRVAAPTTGWVGLGIGEYGAGAMPGGDFVVCTAEGTIEDRWAPGYVTPILDTQQDWTLHYSGGDGSESWCIMSRALDTEDTQDRPIDLQKLALGPVNLMFAYGTADAFNQHGPTQRSTAQLRLLASVDLMTKLLSMPDYDSNVTLNNNAVQIPHDQATCEASLDSLTGASQCEEPHTTYHEAYHPMIAFGERSIIGATPSIAAATAANVHHFVASGYTSANCTSGEIGPIYIWAPGAELQVLPEFLGVKLNGADGVRCIGVQTHYDNPLLTAGLVDSSGPVFHMTAINTVRPTELGVIQINDPSVSLAGDDLLAGWSKYSFDCSGLGGIGDPGITFFSVNHHMHVAGQMMQTNITRPGMDDVIWTTEHYDFNFQTALPVNVTIKGSERPYFTSYCAFDNSVRTQHPYSTPSGKWGKGSNDEMCIDFLWYYPRISGVIECPLSAPAQTVLTLPNEDAGWVPMSSRRVDLTITTGDSTTYSVPNGQTCFDNSGVDMLLYCSWDGAMFRGNMIQWDGLTSASCSADLTGVAGFSKESVENGGVLNGLRFDCDYPTSPAARATGFESLGGPGDLGRVFGTTAADPVTFTGFLADTVCLGIINSVDSTNVTTDAPAHTVECMLLQYCIDSGFTILEEVGGNYRAKYQLDANGVTLAVAALRELSTLGVVNNVNFTVTGIPGAAATFNDAATYNGQPLGVVLATSAVVAGTPGAEITNTSTDDSSASDTVVEEIEVVGGIVIGLVAVAAIVVLIVLEKKGQAAEAKKNPNPAKAQVDGFGL